MGRLKAGEALNTPPSFPPSLPKKALKITKTPRTRTRSQKFLQSIAAMQVEEEETNSNNHTKQEDDVARDDTGPLSLLRKFPDNAHNNHYFNQLAPATRELYASTAESVKKLLVSELSYYPSVETMVELANKAFETLDWLQADYAQLYDAVKAHLTHCAQLSSAESELLTHQNEEKNAVLAREANRTRAEEAVEAVARSEAEYEKAEVRLGDLENRVSETREVLKKLLSESMQRKAEVAFLEGEWKRCSESRLEIMKEDEELAEKIEEKRKIVEKIEQRYKEAEALVERSIMTLSSLS
jgi:chromosome segregation ATPase|uniref:Uncharacterized protein n=1 Tax=Fagus sylvatica TaxID=28930 RepID=A0A2N9GZB9_FAGSY